MKICLLSFAILFLSYPALAEKCVRGEFRGVVRDLGPELTLVLGQGTLSEKKLIIPAEFEWKYLAYLNTFIQVSGIAKQVSPVKYEVVRTLAVQRVVPDPLRTGAEGTLIVTGEVPCK